MKNFRLIIAALALCLVAFSCSKKEENVIVDDPAVVEDNTPAIVELTSNLTTNIISTKAALTEWNEQALYFYAFKTGTIPNPDTADSVNILINNAKANAPASTMTGEIDILKVDDSHYYYTADQTTYDFYGYYVADAATTTPINPTITPSSKVTLPITINGTQDIMLATTDKNEDATQGDKTLKPTDLYSTYSARNGVKPNLKFEHQLSRFVFRVIAGNDEGKKVRIDTVKLSSLSEADLIIAELNGQRGLSNTNTSKDFSLKKSDGTLLNKVFPKVVAKDTDGNWQFPDTTQIGESIMVIPSSKHHFVMNLQQCKEALTSSDTLGKPFKYEYDLTPSMVKNPTMSANEFEKGYQYNVNIVVYGREKVTVNVTLSEWNEGGTITIDNDTEWGDNPKCGMKTTTGDYLFFYGNDSTVVAVGDSVRVWDKTNNEMVSAPAPTSGDTTFVFDSPKIDTIAVKLQMQNGIAKVIENGLIKGKKADGTKNQVTYGLYFYGGIAETNEVKVWNGEAMEYAAAGTYTISSVQGVTSVELENNGTKTTVKTVNPQS